MSEGAHRAAARPRICNTNRPLTKSGQDTGHAHDPEHSFDLRQVDQAGTDFAAIESNLDIIHQQLARQPA
jgi:hypothetical protein